jgi:hypothetical protein
MAPGKQRPCQATAASACRRRNRCDFTIYVADRHATRPLRRDVVFRNRNTRQYTVMQPHHVPRLFRRSYSHVRTPARGSGPSALAPTTRKVFATRAAARRVELFCPFSP